MSFTPACLVVAGPSGVGKSTLITNALKSNDNWIFSISATTRKIRPSENGSEYHFVEEAKFSSMVIAGEFLEYADVYGNKYGTPASEIDRARGLKKNLLIEVDTVGCLSIRALRPEIPLLAVLPPSIEELKHRLIDRKTESEESLKLRFSGIIAELQRMRGFDYTIINDDLETAQNEFLDLLKILEPGLHRVADKVDNLLQQAGGSQ